MVFYILMVIAAALVSFVAVLLIRTFLFRPGTAVDILPGEEAFDKEKAVENLRALILCKTVSRYDHEQEDEAEFKKLIDKLPALYPHVFEACTLEKMPDWALLFRWEGKTQGDPSVLMAHYDVVPANEEEWDKPPFGGVIENGILWGRGTLDTKITFNGVLTAADHLIAQGFRPEHDIYFAFSGGEEVKGPGAVHIVDYFENNGITPALVVDEGGAVVENVFPGVNVPCGLIGIAEKGMMDVEYKVKSAGGHASAPSPHTPVGILSKACCRIESHPFKARLSRPVAEMFDTLGRHSTFGYRMIFANMWCFFGILDRISRKKGGDLNALLRTTAAFTCMNGSDAFNVIPPSAMMVSNLRLNPGDTMESAMRYLKETVGDQNVEITKIQGDDPSRVSETDCPAWDKVARAAASTWKGCVVSPYLMVQCSDSCYYGRISDHVYRFSAMDLTREERSTIHGNNERVRLETVHRAVEFYIRLMKQC